MAAFPRPQNAYRHYSLSWRTRYPFTDLKLQIQHYIEYSAGSRGVATKQPKFRLSTQLQGVMLPSRIKKALGR